MKTHKQRIYQFLKAHEGKEFNHRKIIDSPPIGLGISEYSGRLTDIREDIGCTCGKDRDTCTATEHIINVRKNFYKYINSRMVKPVAEPPEPIDIGEVKRKLHRLRVEWTKNVDKRSIIEIQAKALTNILEPFKEVEVLL